MTRTKTSYLVGIAAILGFNIGMAWISILDPTPDPGHTLNAAWTILLWISCPVIEFMKKGPWLVPILNGTVYMLLVFCAQFLAAMIRPFRR